LDPKHAAFPYQVDAVSAVRDLPFAALFHEQGLGKTKIGIDLALEWLRSDEVDCVLFVTKRSLVQNWIDELSVHTDIPPSVLDQEHGSNFYALNSSSRFLITHYEVLKSEEKRLSLFLKTRRVAAILDESQKIKNPDAELTKAALRLAPGFEKRIVMSGTPIANRPYDLWSQIKFLDGGDALGHDFEAFKNDLDLTNDLWRDDNKRRAFEKKLASLFDKIRPFTVRETKSTAGIELPDKIIENVPVPLETRQAELYASFRDETRAEVLTSDGLIEDDAEAILKRLLRLVQVASNPGLVDASYKAEPGKLPVLLDLVERAIQEDSKVIVWTSFVENAEWICRCLKAHGAVVVHGGLEIKVRNAAVRAFKTDPDVKVLVATPGAAKEGLTLTVANHAIFYDRSFSLDDYLQAQDRIHRISQTQQCTVWNLIGKDTVDEWVDALLAAKRLAAQLAQSDLSEAEYHRTKNYDFGRMIAAILGAEN
jgi:SNF2 family DNA or RNA helicase